MVKVSNGNATFKVYYRENSVMLLTIFWSHLCWFICLLIASLVLPSQQIFSCSKSTILEKCDKIGPKLATKISERCQWRHSGVFIVNYKHGSNISLQFRFLTSNKCIFFGLFCKPSNCCNIKLSKWIIKILYSIIDQSLAIIYLLID